MRSSAYQRGMHGFAILLATSTLGLICVGGLVTSHEAGLAVPDWPTTYGYNMFFFPISLWSGGIFYEHTHRLIASVVGLLTIVLAVWLWMKDDRRWLRWLGIGAVFLVILQGVMGGLRVTEMMDELGIVHATLAQLFFVMVSSIALFTSNRWLEMKRTRFNTGLHSKVRLAYGLTTLIILVQLMLGATMRHQHAGLAVPDFPLAYGQILPGTSAADVEYYNQTRHEIIAQNPITAFQIWLHMGHRMVALIILIAVVICVRFTFQQTGPKSNLRKWSLAWLGLILLQGVLGAATIWTNKSADITTLHVAMGATSLVMGYCLWLVTRELSMASSSIPANASNESASAPTPRQLHVPA